MKNRFGSRENEMYENYKTIAKNEQQNIQSVQSD